MTTNPELLPCPFCGSKVGMHKHSRLRAEHIVLFYIRCECCGLQMDESEQPPNLITRWQTRTPDTLSQKQALLDAYKVGMTDAETVVQRIKNPYHDNNAANHAVYWMRLECSRLILLARDNKTLETEGSSALEGALSPASGNLMKGGGVNMASLPSEDEIKRKLTSPETPSGASRGAIESYLLHRKEYFADRSLTTCEHGEQNWIYKALKELQQWKQFKHSLLTWLREQVEENLIEDEFTDGKDAAFQQVIDHIEKL